jgi:glycosyltransferase involved in cell wall biosynthesis
MASGSVPRLRVALDGAPLLGDRTGIGRLTEEMLVALAGRGDIDVSTYVISRTGRRDIGPRVPPGVRVAGSVLPARYVYPLWERGWGPRIERWTGRVDVVHATNYRVPPARAAVVVSLHDLTFVQHPELVDEETRRFGTRLVELGIRRGATVHVISDFVGAEVRAHFGLPPERVVRVYPGVRVEHGSDATAGAALAGTNRYVLAVGTIEPRKNYPALVRAFDAVAATTPDLALVVAGRDGWDRPAFDAAVASAAARDRIRTLGYVNESQRADLLAGATVFAYPSLVEGFGFPPLEAMLAGVPVVAARQGTLEEVLGDAALLADPGDVDALAGALATAIGDDDVRGRLVTAGTARAGRYTWERTGAGLAELYGRLIANP